MNDIEPKRLLGIFDKDGQKHQAGSVWDKELISPTLDTMMGGYRQPMIIDKPIQVTQLYSTDKEPNPSGGRVYSTLGTMRTLGVGNGMSQPFISEVDEILESLRIRKLTPKECWRLMGFKDEEFERAESAGISNTQLYKQAGNSIVVDTLMNGVFKYLFIEGVLDDKN